LLSKATACCGLGTLRSGECCVNLKKQNLDLRSLRITNINALSRFRKLTSLLKQTLSLHYCWQKLSLDLRSPRITNINALSCLRKITFLLELTLSLCYCKSLLDLDPLSSMERRVNQRELNLNLQRRQITNIGALSCLLKLTSLLELRQVASTGDRIKRILKSPWMKFKKVL
jgi:hypothetical protein